MSIGARYYKENNKQKILGADVLVGVLLSLSYDKCPIDPSMYLDEYTDSYIDIQWDNLAALIDRLAEELGKELKPLQIGSAKQYLSALRNGRRANHNGVLPPLNVYFDQTNMILRIPKRNFNEDYKIYSSDLPDWIFK